MAEHSKRDGRAGNVDGRSVVGVLPRRNVSQDVADHIRALIFSGELKPGVRVPQDHIALDLGVSRLPVREALLMLESEGLIESEVHRGAFVAPIDVADIEDQCEVYGLAQGVAAARMARRGDGQVLERLDGLLAQMDAASTPEEFDSLHWEFHRVISVSGGSRRLRVVLRILVRSIPPRLFQPTQPVLPLVRAEHVRILEGLRGGDPEAALQACRAHLQAEGQRVISRLRGTGFWDATERAARGRS